MRQSVTHLSTHPFIHSFFHSFILSFILSFIHWLSKYLFQPFPDSCIRAAIHPSTHTSSYPFLNLLIHGEGRKHRRPTNLYLLGPAGMLLWVTPLNRAPSAPVPMTTATFHGDSDGAGSADRPRRLQDLQTRARHVSYRGMGRRTPYPSPPPNTDTHTDTHRHTQRHTHRHRDTHTETQTHKRG